MAFVRIPKIKGRHYRYREERWRDGGKVRSRSICLGPVGGDEPEGGFIRQLFRVRTHGFDWAAIEREELARQQREADAQKAFADKMHQLYGMNLATPAVPVEKVASVEAIGAPATPAGEENASPEGEANDQ